MVFVKFCQNVLLIRGGKLAEGGEVSSFFTVIIISIDNKLWKMQFLVAKYFLKKKVGKKGGGDRWIF